jgi:hypothetical protein
VANGQLFTVLNETKVTLGRNCPWTIFLQNFTRVQAAMHNKIVQQFSAPLMKFSGFRRSLRTPESDNCGWSDGSQA